MTDNELAVLVEQAVASADRQMRARLDAFAAVLPARSGRLDIVDRDRNGALITETIRFQRAIFASL